MATALRRWPFGGLTVRWHTSPSTVQKAFRRALLETPITKPATVHTLRHAFASHLLAAALTVASAIIGPIISPSTSLVICAFLSSAWVARLFLAGVIPGILIGIALMLFNRTVTGRRGFPG